ncbi:hypothetical protein [Limnoglobus roseus]|uniref:Transposase n=1 Tax=Limnoglobus roseus TaxID=2598579 RepID=A0A5C1ACD7_9BACT|nr:hypothetical protein [Limnoglobus roseus]QEL15422.1 hypothetical protein PX52LOC_02341 [Limnoglobus roseus]
MRADMGKVLVERPRPGSRDGSRPHKGYQKAVHRAMGQGGGPVREGMTQRCGGTRHFNEHLAPLRRFLQTNVGRPWDKIYSEICQYVDRGNVVQKHILTHLFDYVVTKTIVIDSVPCLGQRMWPGEFGQPLRDVRPYREHWYVCPVSGLLKKFKHQKYNYTRSQAVKKEPKVHRLTETMAYREVADGVELIRLAPLPENWTVKKGFDVLLKRSWSGLSKELVHQTYGRWVYAVAVWRASKRELKQYPVPFELIR